MTVDYEKTHDGVMNSVDSTIGFVYGLEWPKFGNTLEYHEASQAMFKLFKALEEKNLTDIDDEE